jgi:phage protein D
MAAPSSNTSRIITAWLEVIGEKIPCGSASCTLSKLASSDSLSAECPLHWGEKVNADWWNALTSKNKATLVLSDGRNTRRMLSVPIDSIELKFLAQTASISARNNDKKAIESRSDTQYPNHTSRQVVSEIAAKHGWQVQFDAGADTSSVAGKIHHIDQVVQPNGKSDWHLVQRLAEEEGVDAWLSGDTLYFKNADDDKDPLYVVRYQAPTPLSMARGDFMDLTVKKELGAGKTVTAKVHSWHSKQKKQVDSSSTVSGDGNEAVHEEHVPNLTQQQADKRAKKNAKKLARHENGISLSMVGDLTISPQMRLKLVGAGTVDSTYYIDSVAFSVGDGLRMSIEAKNQKPGRKQT